MNLYINKKIPYIQKMAEARKGNIDVDYFQDIIQNKV